jgi:protein-disulfide isomerase
MASRAEHKQQARARRLAEEQSRLERKRRQRRVFVLGGVVLGAVAVVAVAIAVSGGGGGSTGLTNGNGQATLVAQVERLLGGIPQSGATLGNPRAPVTMTYYSDLQCPVCAEFTLTGGFPELVAKDARAGKVKVVYRAFETTTRDPQTFQAQQIAALAAGRQKHFWDYVELFYRQQGTEGTSYVTETYLNGRAQQVPALNVDACRSARNESSLIAELGADRQSATTARVQGTPTLIFQGPRGTAQTPETVPSYDQLQQAIKSVA